MHAQFRAALEALDLGLIRKMWAHVRPGMPQPESNAELLISAHMARTAMVSCRFAQRAYSHAWLTERGLPSQLPDHLKPRAQQICPVIVPGVGIAVHGNGPISLAIRQAMVEAVLDAGLKDEVLTKRAILDARLKARRQLLGTE